MTAFIKNCKHKYTKTHHLFFKINYHYLVFFECLNKQYKITCREHLYWKIICFSKVHIKWMSSSPRLFFVYKSHPVSTSYLTSPSSPQRQDSRALARSNLHWPLRQTEHIFLVLRSIFILSLSSDIARINISSKLRLIFSELHYIFISKFLVSLISFSQRYWCKFVHVFRWAKYSVTKELGKRWFSLADEQTGSSAHTTQ